MKWFNEHALTPDLINFKQETDMFFEVSIITLNKLKKY